MSDELQRTEAWHKERAGKFTGSKFADVLARNKRTGDPLKAYHADYDEMRRAAKGVES